MSNDPGTPPQALTELLEVFERVEDRAERIALLIDIAERFEAVPETVASRPFDERHRVPHCESEAFVWAGPNGEGLRFYFAVENPQGIAAKAVAVILAESASGARLEEVLALPGDLPYRLFGRELSVGKNMGLSAMVDRVRGLAHQAHIERSAGGAR